MAVQGQHVVSKNASQNHTVLLSAWEHKTGERKRPTFQIDQIQTIIKEWGRTKQEKAFPWEGGFMAQGECLLSRSLICTSCHFRGRGFKTGARTPIFQWTALKLRASSQESRQSCVSRSGTRVQLVPSGHTSPWTTEACLALRSCPGLLLESRTPLSLSLSLSVESCCPQDVLGWSWRTYQSQESSPILYPTFCLYLLTHNPKYKHSSKKSSSGGLDKPQLGPSSPNLPLAALHSDQLTTSCEQRSAWIPNLTQGSKHLQVHMTALARISFPAADHTWMIKSCGLTGEVAIRMSACWGAGLGKEICDSPGLTDVASEHQSEQPWRRSGWQWARVQVFCHPNPLYTLDTPHPSLDLRVAGTVLLLERPPPDLSLKTPPWVSLRITRETFLPFLTQCSPH